jgi:anti-sigma B factor antagonist
MAAVGPEFDVQQKWIDATVVLSVRGDVDALTAPRLSEAILDAWGEKPSALIVDLSAVDFMASSAMTVLMTAREHVTPTAWFGVVADGPGTSRPLKLMGLDTVVGLHRTLDDALASFSEAQPS